MRPSLWAVMLILGGLGLFYAGHKLVLLMAALGCEDPKAEKVLQDVPAMVRDGKPTAQEVLEDVQATYRDLETYRSEGTVVTKGSRDGEGFTYVMTFRMRLKKPNLYLISWSGNRWGQESEGTIWNDGTRAYFYCGRGVGADRNY